MQRYPIQQDGRTTGELHVEEVSGGTRFHARCQGSGLCSLWVMGTGGELRLGIPEASGNGLTLHRQFSTALTKPVGTILRGELRDCTTVSPVTTTRPPDADWHAAELPLFHSPSLQRQLECQTGVLTRQQRGLHMIALPFDRCKPFPLTSLFCFAYLRRIENRDYIVYAFDRQEQPVFWE